MSGTILRIAGLETAYGQSQVSAAPSTGNDVRH